MVYEERNTWATLIATVITVPIYIVIVLVAGGWRTAHRGGLGADPAVDDGRVASSARS